MSPDATAVTASPPAEPALCYIPRKGLLRLVVATTLLNIVTLSFYRFWARTRWRRHIWGSVHLRGDPFEYHGTGFEMFKGFLVAIVVLAPALIALKLLEHVLGAASPYVTVVVIGGLSVVAQFYAWRYRASRTSWRGVRLRVVGGLRPYLRAIAPLPFVLLLSGFILYPHCRVRLRAKLLSMTAFGDQRLDCDVRLWPLYKYWAIVLVGLVIIGLWGSEYGAEILGWANAPKDAKPDFSRVTFAPLVVGWMIVGIGMVAYRVAEFRAIAAGLRLGEVRFVSRARGVTVGAFLAIWLGMIAIVAWFGFQTFLAVVTGLAGNFEQNVIVGILVLTGIVLFIAAHLSLAVGKWAWITPWILDHLVKTLSVESAETLDTFAAGIPDNLTRGEGLADSFDVGIA